MAQRITIEHAETGRAFAMLDVPGELDAVQRLDIASILLALVDEHVEVERRTSSDGLNSALVVTGMLEPVSIPDIGYSPERTTDIYRWRDDNLRYATS